MPAKQNANSYESELADAVAKFYEDPLGFVLFAYEWDKDPSLQMAKLPEPYSLIYNSEFGPDLWACEILTQIGEQVKANKFDGRTAVPPIRMAVASGHGIGKSAITAWITNWIMSTRPFAKGVVTANTAEQLASKTWAEIAKWTKRCITGHWFTVTTGKGAMRMTHNKYPESWRCDAQTCREENSEAFAGLHAVNSTPFYIFDEASAVPDSIKQVAEGGMTDGEPMMFAFGNPTRNTGWFRDCFDGQAHRWKTKQIDSRTVQITNKKVIDEWIADYGEDSDFVKVRVRGMFPAMSSKQFISSNDVDAAYGRHLRKENYEWAPKILTVDPAWEGDDEFVIGLRQGLLFRVIRTVQKNDNDVQMANIIAGLEDEHKADAVFVDGGYGTGIVSVGRTLGRSWLIVWFAEASTDPGCLNKRAQMWKEMRDWLKAGGSIPEDPVLYRDLIGPETVARVDGKIQLEAKKDMKRRGVASPNRADALALSFAFPVHSKALHETSNRGLKIEQNREYNPFEVSGVVNGGKGDYDPFMDLL
jgi:hypothetical protein